MPLARVWFFGLAVLNRVYNLKPVLNRVWYYEPRDLNPDCAQSLKFLFFPLRLGPCEKFKELAIERRTSDAFLSLILSEPTVTQTLQCHQPTSDHFLNKNAIVVGILI